MDVSFLRLREAFVSNMFKKKQQVEVLEFASATQIFCWNVLPVG